MAVKSKKTDTNQRTGDYSKENSGLQGEVRHGQHDTAGKEQGIEVKGLWHTSTELPAYVTLVEAATTGSLRLNLNPLRVEPDLFQDEAEYERVTNSVVARIRSGEIQPREPELDEE